MTADLPEFDSLKNDINTDVLIIGGGITGILTALLLQQKGVDYILVEKDKICSGVTGNTTAKVTYQHSLNISEIIKSYGAQTAKQYLDAQKGAFLKLSEIGEKIDCDWEIKDNYVYSLNNLKALEDELNALAKIGYSADLCTNLPLPFKTVGAVRFKNQAQFHPLKFLAHIAKDLNIYENTFVKELKGTTAITDNAKIKAKKIIVTTHFPFINKHGSYFLKLYQHRSYVSAFSGCKDLNGMFVDYDKKGLSFRNYGDLLLLGGFSERTGKQTEAWQGLRDFAKKYYPNSKEQFFWAAQDCMSLDGMAYIGQYSLNTPNFFTATGFNKWGMTGAMLSAMILSDIVIDKPNTFAYTFTPSRSILKPQLLINGLESAKNLLTLTPKRCSHLGCALKWNKAEHTWDCSCHGSRFSKDGKVLDNPANSDLKH